MENRILSSPEFEVPGINIRRPWAELIITGKKSIETRSYDIPKKYLNRYLAVIETSGKSNLPAKIIGLVIFTGSKKYSCYEDWSRDFPFHLVKGDDLDFRYNDLKPKWGWRISKVFAFPKPLSPPSKKGIRYASSCKIPGFLPI